MKLKKSTLVITGLLYAIAVSFECNSSAGQEQGGTGQITTTELRSYLARLHFPEDSTSLHTKPNANDTILIFSQDGDIRADLTERSN